MRSEGMSEDTNSRCSACGGRIKDHPIDPDGFISKFDNDCTMKREEIGYSA